MSAVRWTPQLILSRDWSWSALRRMARDCTDLAEGEAILTAFWKKVDGTRSVTKSTSCRCCWTA